MTDGVCKLAQGEGVAAAGAGVEAMEATMTEEATSPGTRV